ncbi:MAG: ABC transporter ATP-binding protein [Gammaproteobacteria bacterium]|nr:ABC transporter ATP-binding protein [Gammaproteobacteria bacterium]
MAALVAMSLLSAKKLNRRFGGIAAVKDVDFSLEQGEIRGIIGPNGAGKTSFVNLLSGRLAPDSGQVVFQGVDITRQSVWKRARLGIAYSFQIISIYPGLTVFDNVAIGAQLGMQQSSKSGQSRDQEPDLEEVVGSCLKLTGLDWGCTQLASELAYGHQRLLEITINLAVDPTLLILDEPTQGLSVDEIDEFAGLLKRIRSGRTIILIEHNLPFVMNLADRVTVMDQGGILAENDPKGIQMDARVKAAYLGK